MKPLVSVIIPAYNASKTIDRCLESLENQTLKELEIIVINDSSSDNTLELLKKHKNIIIIDNKTNLGPSKSRNRGLKKAKGKYIGFVDSDDYVREDMFEVMSSKMNSKIDLVVCSRINVTKEKEKEIIREDEILSTKEFSSTSNYVWDKLFKKEIIDKNKIEFPEEYSYAEDFAFQLKYKYFSNKMHILKEPLYYYNFDSEFSITNSYKRNLLHIIDVLEYINNFFKEQNSFEKYKDKLLELSMDFYIRRVKEFVKFDDIGLQKEFTKKFLNYFDNNFLGYKRKLRHYKTTKNVFYRSNYLLMVGYIYYKNLKKRL